MWEQIRANKRKSAILVFSMGVLLGVLGFFLGGMFIGRGGAWIGAGTAIIFCSLMAVISLYGGREIMLGISAAKKISLEDNPRLFHIVEEMSLAAGIGTVPDVYIIDDASPNAFATGKDPKHSAIAVTTGLLEQMNRAELQGVVGHEMGHIVNRDTLFLTITGVMLGSIVIIADIGFRSMIWGSIFGRRSRYSGRNRNANQTQAFFMMVGLILMILSPVLAQIIYFSVSRKREYLADASSALFTRYPEGLASALEKISHNSKRLRVATRVTAPSYIVNPLRVGKPKAGLSLLSTHPPTERRIRILRSMGGRVSFKDYERAFSGVMGGKTLNMAGKVYAKESALNTDASIRKKKSVLFAKKNGSDSKETTSTEQMSGVTPDRDFQTDLDDNVARRREVSDMMWRINDFEFNKCDCGSVLKIPPGYPESEVICPRCGKVHHLKTAGK